MPHPPHSTPVLPVTFCKRSPKHTHPWVAPLFSSLQLATGTSCDKYSNWTVLSQFLHSKTQSWTLLLTVVAASRDVLLSLPSCPLCCCMCQIMFVPCFVLLPCCAAAMLCCYHAVVMLCCYHALLTCCCLAMWLSWVSLYEVLCCLSSRDVCFILYFIYV